MNYDQERHERTVINLIKAQRLKWLGHICKAEEGNKVREIME